MNVKAPKVLTRMRLSCCWGDNLNEKELNEVVDYINNLEQQCKKQREVIDKAVEYINQHWVIDDPVCFKNDLLQRLEDKEVSE